MSLNIHIYSTSQKFIVTILKIFNIISLMAAQFPHHNPSPPATIINNLCITLWNCSFLCSRNTSSRAKKYSFNFFNIKKSEISLPRYPTTIKNTFLGIEQTIILAKCLEALKHPLIALFVMSPFHNSNLKP